MSLNPITPTRLLILTLLLQAANAAVECIEDGFGNFRCRDRLSLGARIGIGIGITVAVILLILLAGYVRQRRIQRHNLLYVNYPNQGQNYYPQQSYQPGPAGNNNQYQQTSFQPRYEGYPPNNTNQNGAPPGYPSYAPPTGPPPK